MRDGGLHGIGGELHPARLLGLLGTTWIGRRIVLFDVADSTNSIALATAAAGAAAGTLVLAELQNLGRGRKGRSWASVAGKSLIFSFILRPTRGSEGLTSLTALAAAEALDDLLPGIGIKWPNDLCMGDKKLCGILAESRHDAVVIGIGLNVNEDRYDFPADLQGTAISLRMAAGRTFDRGHVLATLLGRFERQYGMWQQRGLSPFIDEIEQRLLYRGEAVIIESDSKRQEGLFAGITGEGFLRLRREGEELIITTGDLTLRRIDG
jgi:BirA family biotin operon repressor/biotin-[acetyl-CoA-carboxylase] ligase